MKIEFSPDEAVFTCTAIKSEIERTRQFCRETDAKYGDMNNVFRHSIHILKSTHAKLIGALREENMYGSNIEDEEIDNFL